jgi:hypothetical protein
MLPAPAMTMLGLSALTPATLTAPPAARKRNRAAIDKLPMRTETAARATRFHFNRQGRPACFGMALVERAWRGAMARVVSFSPFR